MLRIRYLLCAALLSGASAASLSYGDNLFSLTLNVYQVCDNGGANCASLGPAGDNFYARETNKIWAQAGISVLYNFAGQIDKTAWLNIDDSVTGRKFDDIAHYSNYRSSTVVTMYLVDTVAGAYGEGWLGLGGLVMGMNSILGYGGTSYPLGRIDTMAHELGHNLGLVNPSDPEFNVADPYHSVNANELMAGGGYRHVPSSVADINPSGLGYDQLSRYQITTADSSSLLSVVPEPGTMALVAGALLGGIGLGRFRRRTGQPQ